MKFRRERGRTVYLPKIPNGTWAAAKRDQDTSLQGVADFVSFHSWNGCLTGSKTRALVEFTRDFIRRLAGKSVRVEESATGCRCSLTVSAVSSFVPVQVHRGIEKVAIGNYPVAPAILRNGEWSRIYDLALVPGKSYLRKTH
jgi:hypothetical protein